jgi:purine-binding chemotaxis protein CheW
MHADGPEPQQQRGPEQAAPEWIVVAVSGRRVALPIGRVREVLPSRPLTRFPGAARPVCGLIGVRGRVVTVVDLGLALGLGPSATPDHRVLLTEWSDVPVGLAVAQVVGVAGGRIAQPASPEAVRQAGVDGGDVLASGTLDDEPFLVVDLDRVVSRLLA